jgi:hypothetical protein
MLVTFTLALYDKGVFILYSHIFTAVTFVALANEFFVWIQKKKNVILQKRSSFIYSFKK